MCRLPRHLRRQINRQWPSTEATGVAMATANHRLDEALDQIEQLEAGMS